MSKIGMVSYCALTTALLCGAAAHAQTATEAPPAAAASAHPTPAANEVGEIIVTAQKREERLSKVPLSISAASGQQLANLGVSSAGDLQKFVPGFTFAQSSYGAPVFTIRGIGFYDEAVAIAPAVSVYVDQVPIPYSRMAEAVGLDISRVEVLKGPQGTLFGENSTGGAINYVANKPTQDLQAGADLSYGRFDDFRGQAFVSGPLLPGLTARLATEYDRGGDWQKSITSDRTLGQRNFFAGRLLVDWEPTNALKFEFSANGWQDKSDTQAPQFRKYSAITPTSLDGSNPAFTGFLGSAGQPNLDRNLRNYPASSGDQNADWDPNFSYRRNDSFYQFSLRGDYQINDFLTLTSITAYQHLGVDSPSNADGTQYLNLYVTTLADIKSFTQELRLSGHAGSDSRLKYMIGGNIESDTTRDDQLILFDGTNTGLFNGTPLEVRYADGHIVNQSDEQIKSQAAFGSLDYNLTDAITLQGSVRYTHESRIEDACLRDSGDNTFAPAFGLLSNVLHGVDSAPVPGDPAYIPPGGCATLEGNPNAPNYNYPVPDVHAVLDESNVSWRTGVSWKATPTTMLYGNITRGYKSGSFGTLPYLTTTQVEPIKPEEVTAYEIGLKSSLFDHKLDITAATFYYDYVNKQLLGYLYTGAIFGNLPGEVSIPKSRVVGAELNVAAHPVRGLAITGGATYIDSKVTSNYRTSSPDALYGFQAATDPSCPAGSTVGSCGINIKGSPFNFTPKWNLLGDVQYTFPVSDRLNGFVGVNVTYQSATSADFAAPPDGTPRSEAYTTASDYKLNAHTLVDLRAGVDSQDGKWRFQIWGHNIFDEYYWINIVKIQDTLARVTGRPATFGATLTLRY